MEISKKYSSMRQEKNLHRLLRMVKSVPEIKQTIALLETLTTVEEPVVREIVLEGSVLVNIAKPEKVYTFKDNAE